MMMTISNGSMDSDRDRLSGGPWHLSQETPDNGQWQLSRNKVTRQVIFLHGGHSCSVKYHIQCYVYINGP